MNRHILAANIGPITGAFFTPPYTVNPQSRRLAVIANASANPIWLHIAIETGPGPLLDTRESD